MAAAIAVVMRDFAGNFAAQQAALGAMPAYVSRGKGGKVPHRRVGTAAAKRAARKHRNITRNRRAHRG